MWILKEVYETGYDLAEKYRVRFIITDGSQEKSCMLKFQEEPVDVNSEITQYCERLTLEEQTNVDILP